MEHKFLVEVDQERCKGCSLCIDACPTNVLGFSKGFNAKGYHPAEVQALDDCIGCGFCYQMCPDVCIEVKALAKQ